MPPFGTAAVLHSISQPRLMQRRALVGSRSLTRRSGDVGRHRESADQWVLSGCKKIDCGTVTACPPCRCQDGLPESTLQAACNALQSASLLVIVNDDEVVVVVVAVAVE